MIGPQPTAKRAREIFEFLSGWNPHVLRGVPPDDALFIKVCGRVSHGGCLRKIEDFCPTRAHASSLREAHSYIQEIKPEIREAGHGIHEEVFGNIYDLLLFSLYSGTCRAGGGFFRGHSDAGWHLIPGSCRSHPWEYDGPEFVDEFVRKMSVPHDPGTFQSHVQSHWPDERRAKLAQLRNQYPNVADKCFRLNSEDKEDAVIQHYVSGTPWLDLTSSFFVAAFFATIQRCPNAEMGAVYRISPVDLNGVAKLVTHHDLPQDFLRIQRQRASFLRLKYPRLVDWPGHFVRWCFFHSEEAAPFQWEAMGITEGTLLPLG